MSGIRDTSTLRALSKARLRDSGNVLREAAKVRVRDAGNVLRLLSGVGEMIAVADPSAVYGYGSSKGSIRATTNSATVTVTGGTPPYSYSWPTSAGWGAIATTSATTSFRSPSIAAGGESSEEFACTVTDALGNVAVSNTVTATAYNDGGF